MSKRFWVVLLISLLTTAAVYADGVRRFNSNVDAAATTDWENNWIAHVTAVPVATVTADELEPLPFGMPLSRSPDYTDTGSAKGSLILSQQSALLSTSITNCLIADLPERATRVRLGVEGSVLGILVDLGGTAPTQRFYRSRLASAGCPTIEERSIPSTFAKLYLASDYTLSAKNSSGDFAVLNYDLTVAQTLPATNIQLKTYQQTQLTAPATLALDGATPTVGHGGSDTSGTFYADRIAFDNIGKFGSLESQFTTENVNVTSEPLDSEGLIGTPGGGYGFSGPAAGLDGKFSARPEVLLRVAGAPQDCNPGQISWAERDIDGSGSHVFQVTEETVKNEGAGSNGFVARQGNRWAARYTLGGSSIPSGVGSAGEQALWTMNSEISQLGAGSPASEAVRRLKVKDMVQSWFDNRYIDYKTAYNEDYTGSKYRYFKGNPSSPLTSDAVNASNKAAVISAFADTIVDEFSAWITSGNTDDLNNLILNLQTGLGEGSNARCGVQKTSTTIEVPDLDNLSERGKAYIDYLGQSQIVYDSWFEFDEGDGDAHVDVKVAWKIKDVFTEGTLINKAKVCISSNGTSKDCVDDILSSVTQKLLEAATCASSSYNYVAHGHTHYDYDTDNSNSTTKVDIAGGTHHAEPHKTVLNPLGCYPWQTENTDADSNDPAENPRFTRPWHTNENYLEIKISEQDEVNLGNNVNALFSTKTITGDMYAEGCPTNDNVSDWPDFIVNGASGAFPGPVGSPWTHSIAGFKAGAGTEAEQAKIKSFLGRGFYRTKTKITNVEGGCEDAFASGEMVTYFYAPSSGNYNLTVDSVGSNQVRTGSSNSEIEVLNEAGAPITISNSGGMRLNRGLHTLRLSFELSNTELAAAVSRDQNISVQLDGSEDPLPLFLSSRLAKASDPVVVNGQPLNTNSDQLWDGEYKPNVFVGLKPGTTSASVTDLRGMGGRFGVQSVHSAGTKLLVVSVDDAEKENPRLRFDLVNSLSSTTADVGVSIDTVGVKTAGLAAADMLKVWQVQPSVAGGAYVLFSFERGSLTFKGDQGWGLWVDTASSIGSKSKSVVTNDVGETFALLKIDPIQGASWASDPLRISEANVATATMTRPGTSNYASIALHVTAGADDPVTVNMAGQEEVVAANTGAHSQLWFNKELGWAASDTELTTLFGQPPYKIDSGVVGIPLNLNIARIDPNDPGSAVISAEEIREAVTLQPSMLFLPTSMPAGSTVENSVIVKQAQDNTFEIIPLRPGQFQLQFQRSVNNPLDILSVIVDSRMPATGNVAEEELLVTHIVDAPPVDLDPSLTDEHVFVQMAYAQAPSVNNPADVAEYSDLKVFGKLFYHDDPQKLNAENEPAQAVLVYKTSSEWKVRVVQSYRWNNVAVFDMATRKVARIGEQMDYPGHYKGAQGDIQGYLVGEEGHQSKRKSVINLDIIDDGIYAIANMEKRSQAISPLYPVADNSKFFQGDENTPPTYQNVDVVWYDNNLNAAWPHITVRYDTVYPSYLVTETKFSEQPSGTAPSIIIGSQLGSEGFSSDEQADAYEGADDAAKEAAAKAELYFEPDLTQNLKIYRQPIRGEAGFNPNEEHALIAEAKGGGGKRKAAFALRNDLNSIGDNAYTSEPFVLVQYEKRSKRSDGTYTDWLPAMRGYHVRSYHKELQYNFLIAGTAGQPVAPPYPLDIILPSAQGPYMGEQGETWFDNSEDKETGIIAPMKFEFGAGTSMAFWQDRNGEFWHAAATLAEADKIKLNWAYPVQEAFDVPEHLVEGGECVVPQNGIMLWCIDGADAGEKRVISTHTVGWPEKVAELWAGETVTFAGGYASAKDTTKEGLPGVIGMASLEVLYDSKNPLNGAFSPEERKNKFSAVAVPILSETTQEFSFADWPDSLKPNTKNTEVEGEKWLFADLAPTFKDRLYYDVQRQKLIFKGRLAGKSLGDETLTQAPIGPVLMESNVANQELVNQIWDLFDKHNTDTENLKQSVATLLRKSREPDYKNPDLNSNLLDSSELEDKPSFEAAVLGNWLVGTRDIADSVAIKTEIEKDVNSIFSGRFNNLLTSFVDHHESNQLKKILQESDFLTGAQTKLESVASGGVSCNATNSVEPNYSGGIVYETAEQEASRDIDANKVMVEAKAAAKAKASEALIGEFSRWLINDVRLVLDNTSLKASAYETLLENLKGSFDLAKVVQVATDELNRFDGNTVSVRAIGGKLIATINCSVTDAPKLKDELFSDIKLASRVRAELLATLRKKIRGSIADAQSGSLLGNLNHYWNSPKTKSGSFDKPKTLSVLANFNAAVDSAIDSYLLRFNSASQLSELLGTESAVGKVDVLAWKEVAKQLPFSVALYADPDDPTATGGVSGLKDRIDTWKNSLKASSENANFVNRAALGPGIALVSNPDMLKGGVDWSEPSYLTAVENNDESVAGLPISIHVIKVNPTQLATPALMPLQPSNVFDEKVSLMVSNDFAGNLTDLRFDWRWREDTGSETDRNFLPDTSPVEMCEDGSQPKITTGWEKAIPFEGDAAPLGHHTLSITGNSYKALVDNLVYVRYAHQDGERDSEGHLTWSAWLGASNHNACHITEPNYVPQLAIGWVKRVITGLNPFEARMKEITGSEDAPASYVSMLQQAGQRYEGPIALNGLDKDVVESMGLIQAYETVLKRARNMSIDRAESIFRESVGSAIQLVSNRLSQLYTLMGNEAYNDSLDGTVPNVDGETIALANLHAFKNMTGSSIDEELALLRGKEEIGASPTYNRLLWNYTKGEGEVAYNSTYYISDVDQSGLINEQDAGRLYPQGHGDAWGHYLHALDYYYSLMTHQNYTWVAMGEGFTLAGQAFTVDYNDEEQFARIAAEKAQVGATVSDITFRKLYDPLSGEGVAGYPDDKEERAWGVAEWAQRATTGAYFDWLAVNSMTPAALPDDYNPVEDGIGIIARSAIPEISTIATSVGGIASTLNALEAGTNPFGLNDAVVAYDLDTARYQNGDGLFRQTWERADTAVKNAHTIFTSIAAARRTQKEVAQTADEWLQEIEAKDREYRDQLIEIFGKPYEGAIGAGKPYPEGYEGPDLQFYNFVDVNEVSDATLPQTNAENLKTNFSTRATLTKMGGERTSDSGTDVGTISTFMGITDNANGPGLDEVGFALEDLGNAVNGVAPTLTSYDVLLEGKKPDGVKGIAAQAPSDWGERIVKGKVQTLVHDALMAEADLQIALQQYNELVGDSVNMMNALQAEYGVPPENFKLKNEKLDQELEYADRLKDLEKNRLNLQLAENIVTTVGIAAGATADGIDSVAGSDATKSGVGAAAAVAHGIAGALDVTSGILEAVQTGNAKKQLEENWKYEKAQQSNELEIEYDELKQEFSREREAALRSVASDMNALLGGEPESRIQIMKAQEALSAAVDAYRTELDRGLRLLEERAAYNSRIAARIQQLRYKDSTSRVALDALSTKYRRAFDLAARYVYMASRAYDYETNLKPENALSGASQVANLSKQRLVGKYETQGSDFVPVVGYGGLAETLAILKRNYDVLVSRLGLSVTDTERNVFSLRKEMLNIGMQAANDDRWLDALSEKYRVDDLWTAPRASAWRTYARTFAPRDAGVQPGLIIPFSTKIVAGKNYFGKDLKGGDSAYDPSSAVTRIESLSVILEGYDTQNLSATPRVYVVPVGIDRMIYADSDDLEYTGWQVKEKVLPLVFETSAAKVEATNFNPYEDSQQGFVNAIKKYSTLRAYTSDAEASANDWKGSTRLAGRSVWNDSWLLVIPGQLLLNDADTGLNRLIYGTPDASGSVALKDIKLLINSTAVSGN